MLGVEFFDGIEAADPKFLTAEAWRSTSTCRHCSS